MATAPQPPHRPTPPPPLKDPAAGKSPAIVTKTGEEPHPATDDRPTIGVKGLAIEDGERDPDTVAEEQRRRSAEIEAMGVEAWKAARDERSDEEKAERRVEGAKKLENHKAP